MDKKTITLFVYGGLLKGMTLSPFIENARYLGPGYINAKIYFLGQFPGIVDGNDKVFGELYELDIENLPALDKIEDYHPENEEKSSYIRKKVDVNVLPGKGTLTAEAYFYNRPIEEEHIYIAHGDYRRFIWEVEKEDCWIVKNIVGGKTNGFLKDIEQKSTEKTGFLQVIDWTKSNGKLLPKKEHVQLLKLEKEQFRQIDEIKKVHPEYLSFSVPFSDEQGNTDVAFAFFSKAT